MLSRLGKKIGALRRRLSRSEWTVHNLKLRHNEERADDEHAPAVLMIQIDGLGYDKLLHAIDKKKLPFLQRLVQRDNFVLRPFYSGLPSATPAVQAELFYGVSSAVPAFKYYDRRDRREKAMFEAEVADDLAHKFEKEHDGLLAGGSSYCNIFGGGAEEVHFCIQSMKLKSIFNGIRPRKIVWFVLINLEKIVRTIGLALLEAGLAVIDFFKGIFQRRNPFKELKFVFSRIGVSIILRELVRLHVKIDIARGLSIIHANFVGYDEHAHRRNPDSAFALWTLKGIDATIKDIVHKAVRSGKRDYRIYIYSDHGQENTTPFSISTGMVLQQAVAKSFAEGVLYRFSYEDSESIIPHFNMHRRNLALFRRTQKKGAAAHTENAAPDELIHITAMGPLGHIYVPIDLTAAQKKYYARQLVEQGRIPLVFYVENNTVIGVNRFGSDVLSCKISDVFGADHPFLQEVAADMETICLHPHAGDFIISGWLPNGQALSFPIENGAHGGPGKAETRGFVILPDTSDAVNKSFLRPLDLRKDVEDVRRTSKQFNTFSAAEKFAAQKTITVMSYNIHSCLGVDGKLFPDRIARIAGRLAPDIIALQEVDRNLERSGNRDQTLALSERLDMHASFFPVLKNGDGGYGLAVLSRYPIQMVDCTLLPQLQGAGFNEKRGVMNVTLETHAGPVHIFNTHLSLMRRERMLQMKCIIDDHLQKTVHNGNPVIFCGDLNCSSNSPTCKLLAQALTDCQNMYPGFRPDPTFFSSYPLMRLDHIFHSYHLQPLSIRAIDDWECRLASDHLPVLGVLQRAR